jgi:hypothetical protein
MEQSLYGEGVDAKIDFVKTDKGKLGVSQLRPVRVHGQRVQRRAAAGTGRPSRSRSTSQGRLQLRRDDEQERGRVHPKTGWDIAAAKAV